MDGSFYRSRKWRSLLDVLKNERLDDDGNIICAYCGKPITRAYDIIGHHKIELTDENVNDADIALNPDNIDLVHHRCHNYIHEKFSRKNREVFLVYGAPCSGKTTWVRDSMSEGDLVIDIDSIWQCISGCDRYVKPNRLKSVVFKMRDCLLESVRYRFGKWEIAYVIGGYPMSSERERLCKDLGAREIFIDTPRDECLKRLEADPDRDTDEWKGYIDDWFDRFNPSPGGF